MHDLGSPALTKIILHVCDVIVQIMLCVIIAYLTLNEVLLFRIQHHIMTSHISKIVLIHATVDLV